jgi:beta-lactamase class A
MTSARALVPISPRPELPFEKRLGALEKAFSGRLGYHAVHLDTGKELALRADEVFPTASVIKVGLVCAALDVVARGEASLDDVLPLPPRAERVAGGGVLKQLDVESLTLRDLVELAVCVSDNVAANVIHERCGGSGAANGYLAGLGLVATQMQGPIDFSRITHDADGGIGASTPRDQTRLLTLLQRDEMLTPELCKYVRGVLGRQHLLDQLPRWLGWNTYAQYHRKPWPLWVGSKSGELDGIRADIAIVRSEAGGTAVLAVFTDGGRDLRETVDVEGSLAVAECSAAICARLLGLDC